MTLYKNKLNKVKSPRSWKVKWYEVYSVIRTEETDRDFYLLLSKHPCMSLHRVAYNTIKRHYSTTAINEMRLKYGHL